MFLVLVLFVFPCASSSWRLWPLTDFLTAQPLLAYSTASVTIVSLQSTANDERFLQLCNILSFKIVDFLDIQCNFCYIGFIDVSERKSEIYIQQRAWRCLYKGWSLMSNQNFEWTACRCRSILLQTTVVHTSMSHESKLFIHLRQSDECAVFYAALSRQSRTTGITPSCT